MRYWTVAALVATVPFGPRVAAGQDSAIAIRGATVIPGGDAPAMRNATIVIRRGRLAAVGPSASVAIPRGARVIDGRGRFIIPGLIDTHFHLALRLGTPNQERALAVALASGITGIRDASGVGREREMCALRDRIDADEMLAPRLYVSGTASPRNLARYRARGWDDLLLQMRALGVDGVKLRDLTRAQADTVIRLARVLELPAYGHTYGPGLSLDNFSLDALDAGAAGIMHAAGAGPADSERRRTVDATDWQRTWLSLYLRWLDASEEQEERFLQALLARHAWLEPTLAVESFVLYDARYRGRPENRFLEVPYDTLRSAYPAFSAVDLELARQGFRRMQAFVRRLNAADGLLLAGSDMFPWPGPGVHEELRLLVEAGLSPRDALRAATSNAARALGWDTRTGTIAVGFAADLVILDADPLRDIGNTTRIHAVVRAGHVLDRAALDHLLAPPEAGQGP